MLRAVPLNAAISRPLVKFAHAEAEQEALGTQSRSVLIVHEDTSTEATMLRAVPLNAAISRPLVKFAHAEAEQEALGTQSRSVLIVHEDTSTEATMLRAAGVEFNKRSGGFTLFEVLLSLAIFALSVTGLVVALDSMVKTVLETRVRVFMRLALESRLAYDMVDPPVSGDRSITSHGVTFTESLIPVDMTDDHGNEIPGIFRLKIISEYEKETDSLEVLLYRSQ